MHTSRSVGYNPGSVSSRNTHQPLSLSPSYAGSSAPQSSTVVAAHGESTSSSSPSSSSSSMQNHHHQYTSAAAAASEEEEEEEGESVVVAYPLYSKYIQDKEESVRQLDLAKQKLETISNQLQRST